MEKIDQTVFKPKIRQEKRARDSAWTTEDEIEFINNIGESLKTKSPHLQGLRKSELIGIYLEAAAKRTEWGKINASVVIDYARKRIARKSQKENG